MFNPKSDYALNKKNKKAIVYMDAYGKITKLTADDFASVKEFRNWKNWSDMKYHTEDNKDHHYQRHTYALEYCEDSVSTDPGMEEKIEEEETRREQIQYALEQTAWIKEILSETQFRRLWMRYVNGLKLREIAEIEGVSRPCVSDSVLSAKKKVLHHLQKSKLLPY